MYEPIWIYRSKHKDKKMIDTGTLLRAIEDEVHKRIPIKYSLRQLDATTYEEHQTLFPSLALLSTKHFLCRKIFLTLDAVL